MGECLCHGRGWFLGIVEGTEDDYIPDMVEKYCESPAGDRRREMDGAPPREKDNAS